MSDRRPQSNGAGAIERLLARDRAIVFCALGSVAGLALAYTLFGVGMTMTAVDMTRMSGPLGGTMIMDAPVTSGLRGVVLVFLMWWIMMIAMMTPSAAPAVLLFAAIKRHGPDGWRTPALTAAFLTGYLGCWAFFSAAATALQSALQAGMALDPGMMVLRSRWVSGAVLIAAGLYQVSQFKRACLHQCKSPAQFLVSHRGQGLHGAWILGFRHGLFCLGCCWALMALLFVGGVMNLYWIAGLALLVAAEKLSPPSFRVSEVAGIVLIAAGFLLLAS